MPPGATSITRISTRPNTTWVYCCDSAGMDSRSTTMIVAPMTGPMMLLTPPSTAATSRVMDSTMVNEVGDTALLSTANIQPATPAIAAETPKVRTL